MARHSLPKGTIIEGIEEILVELPVAETRVQAEEQLEELRRADEIFLECSSYGIEEEVLTIRYQLPKGYKGLSNLTGLSQEQKQEVAKNILRIRRIEGSQFTTYVDPVNIYANDLGDVKFAHRGIRAVLPPEQHESKEFVYRLKSLIISLFTTHSFDDLIEKGLGELQTNEGLIGALFAAKSLDEIETALAETYPAPVPVKKPEPQVPMQQEQSIQPAAPVYQQAPQAPQQTQVKTQEAPKKQGKKSYITLISSIVAGLLIGVILTYSVLADRASSQVSQVTAQSSDEVAAVEAEKEELQTTVSSQNQSLEAYRLMGAGEQDQAIEAFEAMGDLSDQDKETLKQLYVGHDNPDVVVRAASLDGAYAADTASRLVAMDSDDARDTLMTIDSESPYVQLEQAWIDRNFERVHELANDEMSDSERAQKLSAESYYQEDNLEEAWKKSNELEDIGLKIRIKEKDIKKVEEDDDLDDDEKKDEIDKINDDINDLRDQQD